MKKKGFTLIELLVVIAIIAMLLAILMPALGKVKKLAMRLVCGTNLKGMANALNVYAFDYRDEYPVAGGKGAAAWTGQTTGWADSSVTDKAEVSVAASLFMLVRDADVGVKSFVCTASDQQPFVNEIEDSDVVELWDFGGEPGLHESYSYQMPYETNTGTYPADGTSSPGNAVMADRSPWFDPDLTNGTPDADNFREVVSIITFDASEKYLKQCGNAAPHDREGQNVLFNDGHVEFAKTPDVGTRYDNIYSIQQGANNRTDSMRRNGVAPTGVGGTGNVLVKSKEDSVLVNDKFCD